MQDFLAMHGEKLIDNGYTIVPIQRGKKAPGFDGWQKTRSTKAQLKEWLTNGHKNSGVGIVTRDNPAVDIDVLDDAIAHKLGQWVIENIADAPMRIGRAPKRLFLFRCDEPFRKIKSSTFINADNKEIEHKIEILGDGQQFVAYHVHPDTKKPYLWPNFDGPLETESGALPLITEDQARAFVAYFHEIAEEMVDSGAWVLAKKSRLSSTGPAASIEDNPWLEDSDPVDISTDELRARLMLVPGAEDYDTWVQVGMSLYHQFDGEDEGRELWHEWAETADNYDADALDRRWDDFGIQGKKRAPITARYILKMANEAVAATAAELMFKLRDAFLEAKDIVDWEKARKLTQEAEIDALSRSALASVAKERRDAITGVKTPLAEIKKALKFTPARVEQTAKWAEAWIYDTEKDRFFNVDTKIAVTKQGFDAMFDRKAITKQDLIEGRSTPSSSASEVALNIYQITVVAGRRYMPGQDPIFVQGGTRYANTYADHEIPERPAKQIPMDRRNVERVKNHIAHLLSDPKEQRMLMDWLSWVVQNPGQHVNYAVLLQGVPGDGKTFFAEMMRAVMGPSNVTMLNAHILQSNFTDWCVGQCLNCIEEVRLINDKNKYEILNRIKPYITNTINEVHPKGHPIYNAINTTSYLLFSNYKDALPIDDTDRRYMVLFSRWQRKEALRDFMRENPTYYVELYRAIEESPGAIRAWLLDHEQAAEFNAKGVAPETHARAEMIRKATPEFILNVQELIEEDAFPGVSEELIDFSELMEALMARGHSIPHHKAAATMLERQGWEGVGQIRIGDKRPYFYVRDTGNFSSLTITGPMVDSEKVRSFLRSRRERVEAETL